LNGVKLRLAISCNRIALFAIFGSRPGRQSRQVAGLCSRKPRSPKKWSWSMRSGDVALRLSIVFSVASFIILATGLYEIDRREKSSSRTAAANLADIELRVQALSSQISILNNQYMTKVTANERQGEALGSQIQALTHQYDARLDELENDLRVRRSELIPGRR
jgi:hypothetical protein